MNKRRLTQLQWQFVRNSLIVSFFTGLFIVVIVTYHDPRGLAVLLEQKLMGLPLVVLILIVIVATGLIAGVIQFMPLKKRLDQLLHSVMLFERGTFSHRIDLDGEDEIRELAERLNRMAERVEEQVASLQRLSSERVRMQETVKKAAVTEERQRLARDLHDAVSQQLFAISMMTAAVKQGFDGASEGTKKQITMVEQMANTAQAEMRALLLHLRPAHLEGKSLKEGMISLFKELEQKHGLKVTSRMDAVDHLPKGIEDHLFRIVQEAISNILRHAKASHVEIQLRKSENQVRMKLIDNGIGFDLAEKKHGSYGLQTMRERMNEVGGVLDIVSVPEKGTQLEAKIPVAWKGEAR
ncbi:sensor histidine kinase [Halalkalibacterium ligniniphilum]|uniref:sensor histidine kinase n=1 Tax=Halalkalibacterium ligniniphilum TaxID=1134413 RepID=UPI000346A9C7|nr:sensor histidine kinase [Halalkalibacterium ligniniphilum]